MAAVGSRQVPERREDLLLQGVALGLQVSEGGTDEEKMRKVREVCIDSSNNLS